MGSAVLKKASPSVVTFIYCFLLLSFLFNKIPHQVLAKGEDSGKSGVFGSPSRHSPSATTKGSPTQSSRGLDVSKTCGRGKTHKSCLPNPNDPKVSSPMYKSCLGC